MVHMQRVAAYCRVSTDSTDQANSLASQERYFRSYIARNPDWTLAQIFVDEGLSGTSTKKRIAFHQMIDEAMAGGFDLILTKEISRFARNTLDSIYYTRKLKAHGVGVLFLSDNINTLDPDAELRLTILSSIAQEESRKTSERVKWGQKRRMEQGVVFGRDLLGYDVRGGKLYINEEGAETVRLIFHKFVREGKGTHVIARELREAGIKTATHMKQWSNTVILRVLRNEKAVGDLIQQKTYTPSYLSHEKKYNTGQEDFVVLRDHHEPIVSRELFEQAQQELKRRSPSSAQKAKHSNRYCFSGKIKCAVCGSSFVSRTKKRKDGSMYKSWRCYQAATHGRKRIDCSGDAIGCSCPSVNEENLRRILQKIMETLPFDKAGLRKTLDHAVAEGLHADKPADHSKAIEAKIQVLHRKKEGLIELFLTEDIDKAEFEQLKRRYDGDLAQLTQAKAPPSPPPPPLATDPHAHIHHLLAGRTWDDIFYRNLLGSIIAHADRSLSITLHHLPQPWIAAPIDAARCHLDASVPISVRMALHSL